MTETKKEDACCAEKEPDTRRSEDGDVKTSDSRSSSEATSAEKGDEKTSSTEPDLPTPVLNKFTNDGSFLATVSA